MKDSHSGDCQWLHKQIEKYPLIKYPFDLERLPDDGIYFFYEKGEVWGHGGSKPRIVRVGAHRSGNFKSRLNDHFVFKENKMRFNEMQSAPKDRSIFRKNIGRALLNKEKSEYLKVWEMDFTDRESRGTKRHHRNIELEKRIERRISDLLRRNFDFRYIAVQNEMGGKGLESRLIETIAQCECCHPSKRWLGLHSPIDKICKGKMWLVQHLGCGGITHNDKLRLQKIIDKQSKEFQR